MKPFSKKDQLGDWKSGPKKKKRIKPISKSRQKSMRSYNNVRKKFLSEHPICQVDGCNRFASDIHHRKGRIGSLLMDVRYFLAVCRMCHQKIEINPTWAIENGYSESRQDIDDMENYL